MKFAKSLIFMAATGLLLASCGSGNGKSKEKDVPYTGDPKLGVQSVSQIIKAMTLEEKAKLLVGTEWGNGTPEGASMIGETRKIVPGAAGTTTPIPRLGIPAIVLSDGPAGVRISPTREGTKETFYCTAFPIGTLLASTWDTTLVTKVGKAIGDEALEYGVDVLLGPGMNIHRNPLCGRNFEYFSEDPTLSGDIAASYVDGVQSNGVGTSIKHFIANNQETNRTGNDTKIDERALKEIYYKNFEIAVKKSQPWTVMTSYNRLNGIYTSERRDLLTDVLRGEWGFKGLVMTDWGGGKDAVAQIHAGNDLLMPGKESQYKAIIEGVKDSTLSIEDVNTDVRRILEVILKSPKFRKVAYTNKPDLKAHAAVTRQSASEGMVLLKNKGTLPLSGEIKDIAAFGNTSYDLISGGTGSGDVNEAYTISLEQGLANAGYKMDGNVNAFYMKHLNKLKAQREKDIQAAIKKTGNPWVRMMFRGPFPEVIPYTALIKKAAKESDVAIITIGRNSGEGKDRSEEGDFTLNDAEVSLIKTVTNAFHQAGKKAVVVLNIGGVIETASWKEIPDAILLAWQGGQECGNSIADILKGNVNPSGKLPMTFPVAWADHESSKNFPIVKAEKRDISDLFGMKKNEGKQPEKNVDFTNYAESIYVGYRCFDHFNRPVSYPFGFGLSYTTFEYSDFALSNKKGEITLTCTVKNTGKYAGKEVVELFVAAPGKDMAKPARELRTFAKTKDLQPGEAETVTMKFPVNDLASYNTADHQWQVEKGAYKALFCASEKDIRGTVDFNIKKEITFKD